jgi:hypothetical protein
MRVGPRKLRPALAAMAVLLLVAACGSSPAGTSAPSGPVIRVTAASPAPTPSGTPVPAPTATPVPTAPTATPVPTAPPDPASTPNPAPGAETATAPSPTPDAAAGLRIAAPFELVDNPADTALQATFTFQVGGTTVEATMSGREIHRLGVIVGVTYAMRIDNVTWNKATFERAARGGANNVDGKLTYTRIHGHRVALIKAASGSVALYRLGRDLVMVAGLSMAATKELMTAIIKAN